MKQLFAILMCFVFIAAAVPALGNLLGSSHDIFHLGYFLENLCLVAAFQIPCIYLHELGHAFFALLVGVKPILIRIGRRRAILEAKIANVWFIQALDFSGGVTLFGRIPKTFFKSRLAIAMLGGALAQLIVIALVLLTDRLRLINILGGNGRDLVSAFFFGNVTLLVFSVIPRKLEGFGDKLWCDALSLISLRELKVGDLEEYEASANRYLAHHKMNRGEYAEAESILKRVLAAGIGNPVAAACDLSATLIRMGKVVDAAQILKRYRADKSSELYDLRLNNLIWALLCIGTEDAFRDLKSALDAAGNIDVDKDFIMGGTLGCALIELGEVERGIKLLEKRVLNSRGRIRKRTSPLWLAFLAHAHSLIGGNEKLELFKSALSHREAKLTADQQMVFNRLKARLMRTDY